MVRLGIDMGGGGFPQFQVGTDGAGITVDPGFGTSILISLLSDARATDDDVVARPELATGRRGWALEVPGDAFGSRLWILGRAKLTDVTLRDAEQIAREALAWMVRERIAERVTARAERVDDQLHLRITIVRGRERRWAHRWAETLSAEYDLGKFTLAVEVA